ncbi:Retrovirus-related Pol polyprotein from transposon TNT 1-94 [Morus notabilis]|uniref:Retrovirus-related Pol polyprotein from transposon TNT 1-94 n=1 Tax=Morus notabilis TaxID=981085 RepID=W9SUE5_9ROSA|nr:Retrovirus-related Pol polyprotein from transposon TNT 1-94 [Morus notabilis]
MSDVLRKKHEEMETAYEIMESLEAMFSAPSEKARLDAVRAFMNDKMKKSSSVKAHVLNMIDHLYDAELNGARIDEATQVGIILESLSPDFHEFVNNFVMNKKKSNLTELMNDLQNFESTNKRRGREANVVVTGSSGKNKRNNQNQGKRKKGKNKRPKKAKGPIQKPKGKCFHCNGEGHWKRNCHKYLEELKKKKEQGKSDLLVLETCLVEGDTSAWIIDSGATNHRLSSYTKLADGDYTMKVGKWAMTQEFRQKQWEKVAEPKNKKQKISHDNNTYMWHLRLGHINLSMIERLVKDGPLSELKVGELPVCESCLESKMTKRPFTVKGKKATKPLQLIHSDVCGPLNVQARGGYEYYVTFIDDYSIYGYVYLMQQKSKTFGKFREFRAEVKK